MEAANTPAPAAPVKVAAVETPAVSAPAGALMLLPGEEVLQQLGALYLTNRRAILYAPTILRAAWVSLPGSSFFPPDVSDGGVDLTGWAVPVYTGELSGL